MTKKHRKTEATDQNQKTFEFEKVYFNLILANPPMVVLGHHLHPHGELEISVVVLHADGPLNFPQASSDLNVIQLPVNT